MNKVMHIAELYRYPLKSGAAEQLASAEISNTGILFDRHWMVVSESGRFISQREKGAQKLSLMRAVLNDGSVELIAPERQPLIVPFEDPSHQKITVELHGKIYQGMDAGDTAAKWISDFLPPWKGERFRLVYFPSDEVRKTRDIYTQRATAETEFADGYAVLVTNRASLDDLNSRLTGNGVDPVNMSVFRPNVVLGGIEAWGEDSLREIQIGDVILEIVKPCGRCPITGVTQETGTFSKRPLEPRKTLETFHAGRHLLKTFPHLEADLLDSPMFGQNAVVVRPGRINANDPITVLSTRP